MKKVKIRRATPWDVIKIAHLLKRAAKEQAEDIWYSRLSVNETKQIFHILTLIDRGFVVIAEVQDQKQIVAAMGMSVARDDWSDDWVMQNDWTYVLKTWRDTDVADQLMTAVEAFADKSGNPATGKGLPIIIGMMTGRDTDLKDKLMERRGYQYGGGNFVRAPSDVQKVERNENGDSSVAE
jgi:hypothetical protein